MSAANVLTSKMEMSPMRVTFDGNDLGGTMGNVEVNVEYTLSPIVADQSGSTPRDHRVSGQKYEVTTKLTQIRDKNVWKTVFPYAHLVTSGLNQNIFVDAAIGASAQSNAKVLLLHPLSLPDADLSGDFKFFKATGNSKSKIVYGPSEQASLEIVWTIYPDDTTLPERFFVYGDPSIGLVAASFGAAVAGGGNTGNGTVTGISAGTGVVVTETITLTCVAAAVNGGLFEVDGSVSGPLGNATVGVGFSSSRVAFTINDGATDFVVGDTFTIAATAGNYV